MAIKVVVPESETHWLSMRSSVITSTEVSALFGISPYSTLFEVWHRHASNITVEFDPNERTIWGTRLEASIAKGIAEDQGWNIRRMSEFIFDDELKMGASFDFAIEDDGMENPRKGLLEIKNVDGLAFRDGWLVEDDNIEAPPHIELQVQQQLALSGAAVAYIGALVGGNRVVLIKREPDPNIISVIKKRVASFWLTVVMGEEPKPDFTRDAEFIKRLYAYAEPGKIKLVKGDELFDTLMSRYKEAANAAKAADEQKEAIKAEILTLIDDAEKLVGDGFSVDCGITSGGPVSYERKPYRRFNPRFKKLAEVK